MGGRNVLVMGVTVMVMEGTYRYTLFKTVLPLVIGVGPFFSLLCLFLKSRHNRPSQGPIYCSAQQMDRHHACV